MFERLNELVREMTGRVTIAELQKIETMFDELPDVSAVRDGAQVVAKGRGLRRRMIEDSRLRGGWR